MWLYVVRMYILRTYVLVVISPSQQPLDPIPLTLYQNGLAMYSGPFRPYSDLLTQQFILDLQDGYFPSELKDQYPEGIPFLVSLLGSFECACSSIVLSH